MAKNEAFQRIGNILTLTEYNTLSNISKGDVQAAITQWRQVAPKPFSKLLNPILQKGSDVVQGNRFP